MTCPRCSYYWCWSCGLQVNHWTHKFADNPFGCNFVATNACDMIKKFLIFIVGLILIPILAIGVPILMGVGYGLFGGVYLIYLACKMRVYDWCGVIGKLILIHLSLVGAVIAMALSIAGGIIASGLAALLIIPAVIFHVYLFVRSVIWWRKNLRNTS